MLEQNFTEYPGLEDSTESGKSSCVYTYMPGTILNILCASIHDIFTTT